MIINKYGLPRRIDDSIKREVRQRCGFGCVNCGSAIYQYEHVDPVFAEAKSHDPSCIVLLCGGCHDRVTRGILSKETIKLKSTNPKCHEDGFSFGPFDLGITEPEIEFGTLKCTGVETLIRVLGDDILAIRPPLENGLPFLISAHLSDRDGNEILRIENNEWITTTENWDVEVVGTHITIRKALGDIALVLRTEPPRKMIIERLDMSHRGVAISAREGSHIEITTLNGQNIRSKSTVINGCGVGVDIAEAGVSFGVGGGSVCFESLEIKCTKRPANILVTWHPVLPFNLKLVAKLIRKMLYGHYL